MIIFLTCKRYVTLKLREVALSVLLFFTESEIPRFQEVKNRESLERINLSFSLCDYLSSARLSSFLLISRDRYRSISLIGLLNWNMNVSMHLYLKQDRVYHEIQLEVEYNLLMPLFFLRVLWTYYNYLIVSDRRITILRYVNYSGVNVSHDYRNWECHCNRNKHTESLYQNPHTFYQLRTVKLCSLRRLLRRNDPAGHPITRQKRVTLRAWSRSRGILSRFVARRREWIC